MIVSYEAMVSDFHPPPQWKPFPQAPAIHIVDMEDIKIMVSLRGVVSLWRKLPVQVILLIMLYSRVHELLLSHAVRIRQLSKITKIQNWSHTWLIPNHFPCSTFLPAHIIYRWKTLFYRKWQISLCPFYRIIRALPF